MKKNVRIYETLDSAQGLNRKRTSGGLRLTGVFGKCGVRNSNNRVYEKGNYGKMVSLLQEEIAEKHGVMGELEHPNSMNINLNNVSHKIESIQMNEDGTVTGTILLLNTSKGKEAQAIIEGGLDLYISSRASGQIDESGNVILDSIKTYDLVGTPGFSEARMSICESLQPNQKVHAINESLYYIIENEDEDDEKDEDVIDEDDEDGEDDEDEVNEDDEEGEDNDGENVDEELDEDIDDDDDAFMVDEPMNEEPKNEFCDNDILVQILTRLDEIEAKLDNCVCPDKMEEEVRDAIGESKNWVIRQYTPRIEKWINQVFEDKLITKIAEGTQQWIAEHYTARTEKWITENFSNSIQNWIAHEILPNIQSWITEKYEPYRIQKLSEGIEGWINENFAGQVNQWITEEIAPEIYKNVSDYLVENRRTSIDTIDAMLDMVESKEEAKQVVDKMVKETKDEFIGTPALEAMPNAYKPLWNMCNESKKEEILTRAKLYDFTKEGTSEKFWASIDFTSQPATAVKVNENLYSNYENNVISNIRRFKKF